LKYCLPGSEQVVGNEDEDGMNDIKIEFKQHRVEKMLQWRGDDVHSIATSCR